MIYKHTVNVHKRPQSGHAFHVLLMNWTPCYGALEVSVLLLLLLLL